MIGDQLAGERGKYGNMDDTADKNVESYLKLDGVGPVDNRPSTDKLNQFIQKRKKKRRHDM